MEVLDEHIFLSTPSARRATYQAGAWRSGCEYFYPRPPRGGRRNPAWDCEPSSAISIHALREEGDPKSRRGYAKSRIISIHALREEGDG